jgi:competence protein ComEC
VPAPSWLEIGIYYAILVGALSGWLFAPKQRIWSATALVLIAAGCLWHWQTTRDETRLTVLPLNGGHAVFADAAGQKNDWLVNCGDENAANFTLKPFLRAQGVNRVPRLMLTHGELRSCGGAELLNELFGIGEIYTSQARFRSVAYREIIAEFEKQPRRHRILNRDGTTGCWQVFPPGATDNFEHADDASLVLLGNFYGTRVLLLSDLGREGQSALLSRTNNLRADIVIAGLPDEGEPLCDALLDAARPKIIVIADSEFPANRRAGPKLRARLEQRGIPVVYTRTAGAVTILSRPDGCELHTMAGKRNLYPTATANRAGSLPLLPPP